MRLHSFLAVGLLSLGLVGASFAQPKPAQRPQPNKVQPKPQPNRTAAKPVSAETRAAALAFAAEHHPELATLLGQLQRRNPREFDRAVKQIGLAADRLVRLKDRDADRYALQLESWKLDSRIKLVAARLTMGEDESMNRDLRKLVAARHDVRVRMLKLDRDQLAERLAKTEELVNRAEADPEGAIDRELKRIQATLRKAPRRETPKRADTVETSK